MHAYVAVDQSVGAMSTATSARHARGGADAAQRSPAAATHLPSPPAASPHPQRAVDTAAAATASSDKTNGWIAAAAARRQRVLAALSFPHCSLFAASAKGAGLTVSDFDLDAVVLAAGGGAEGLETALALIAEMDAEGARMRDIDQLQVAVAQRFQTRQALALLHTAAAANHAEAQASNVAASSHGVQASPALPPGTVTALRHVIAATGSNTPTAAQLAALVSRLLLDGMGGVDPALPLSDVLRSLARSPLSDFVQGDPPDLAFLLQAVSTLAHSMRRRVLSRHLLSSPAARLLLHPMPASFTQEQLRDILAASHHSLFWTFRHFNHMQLQPAPQSSTRDVPALLRRLESMHEACTGERPLSPHERSALPNGSPPLPAYTAESSLTDAPTNVTYLYADDAPTAATPTHVVASPAADSSLASRLAALQVQLPRVQPVPTTRDLATPSSSSTPGGSAVPGTSNQALLSTKIPSPRLQASAATSTPGPPNMSMASPLLPANSKLTQSVSTQYSPAVLPDQQANGSVASTDASNFLASPPLGPYVAPPMPAASPRAYLSANSSPRPAGQVQNVTQSPPARSQPILSSGRTSAAASPVASLQSTSSSSSAASSSTLSFPSPSSALPLISPSSAATVSATAVASSGAPTSPTNRLHVQSVDRAVILNSLSFPRCKLFTQARTPVELTDAHLDTILALCDNNVDHAVASLRALDRAGVKVMDFASLHRELLGQLANEARDTLASTLVYPRCTLFTSCRRPIEIEDEDLDHFISVTGTLPLALAAVAQFEQGKRKFFSFQEMDHAAEMDQTIQRRKREMQAAHGAAASTSAVMQAPAAAAISASSVASPAGVTFPSVSAAVEDDSQATLFPLLHRALQGVDVSSSSLQLHAGLRPERASVGGASSSLSGHSSAVFDGSMLSRTTSSLYPSHPSPSLSTRITSVDSPSSHAPASVISAAAPAGASARHSPEALRATAAHR